MITPEQDAKVTLDLSARRAGRATRNRERIKRQEARKDINKQPRRYLPAGMKLRIPQEKKRDVKMCIHCCGVEGDKGFVLAKNEKGSLFHIDCPGTPKTDELRKRAIDFHKQIAIEREFNKIKANQTVRGSQI